MHQIQEKILEALEHKSLNNMTLREIGKVIGEKFPQKVKHHLDQLENKGFLKINRKKKTIERLKFASPYNANIISVPIVGMANCGPATIFANDNIEGYLKISKKILKKYKNVFAVQAQGLSMNKASVDGKSIDDGDYLIIDPENTNPQNGDVVLSIIDDMANIKKYVWDEANQQVVLVSESTKAIPPIYIHEEDSFLINGKVVQVIKKVRM